MNRLCLKLFKKGCGLIVAGSLLGGASAFSAETNTISRPGGYQFDGTISRQVLDNYLSRAITIQNLLTGQGNLRDNIRMIKHIGAKFIGRALCLWNAERNFSNNVQRARENAPKVLAAIPGIILEACVFETVSPRVNQIAIPARVFTAFGLPVEKRHFRYADMIYPVGQRRPMGRNAQVPDESRLETQLWFYYQAITYIDLGCEAIHFGQVEIMNKNDPDNAHWAHLLGLVRAYAAEHARRHMVLCDGHTPTGGLMHDGNPLLDFNEFPLRIKEVSDKPEEAILQLGFSDGIYNRSKGGRTFSGWTCKHLPYLVEFDNYGVSRHPGRPNAKGEFNWVWGYDEITWFAHQSKAYRAKWLRYAWNWVRTTDTNGYVEMPGGRVTTSQAIHWYYANNPSPAVPTGMGDEDTIRAIWAQPSSPVGGKIRVACVGASITYGYSIKNREKNCYPAQMQRLLGDSYDVRNFGISGSTMLKRGDLSYWSTGAYKRALAFNPNVVVIDLAGNDSKPQNWRYQGDFVGDAKAMIASFRDLPSKPRVLLCLPMPAFKVMWGINNEVYTNQIIPMLRKVAFETHTEPVDLYSAFLNKEAWFADNIHPNADGAALMAKVVGGIIAFKPDPKFDLEYNLAARGIAVKVSSFYGYRRLDFKIGDGRHCIVVQPYVTAATHPYVWCGNFFGDEPQTDIALLQRGFHVVYVNTRKMYGSPAAMKIWGKFHALLHDAGLNGKITLIGMGRGGLDCYHWAAIHPKTVSVIYGDNPVCDFKSWPGRERKGKTRSEWQDLLKAYGFKNDAAAFASRENPVDDLAPLAKARIAILHVVGQDDTVVPVQENTDVIERRYRKLGGTIEVIRKPGVGHQPYSLPNPGPIVDFILSHQK